MLVSYFQRSKWLMEPQEEHRSPARCGMALGSVPSHLNSTRGVSLCSADVKSLVRQGGRSSLTEA